MIRKSKCHLWMMYPESYAFKELALASYRHRLTGEKWLFLNKKTPVIGSPCLSFFLLFSLSLFLSLTLSVSVSLVSHGVFICYNLHQNKKGERPREKMSLIVCVYFIFNRIKKGEGQGKESVTLELWRAKKPRKAKINSFQVYTEVLSVFGSPWWPVRETVS